MHSVKSETNCITTIGTVNSGTAMLRQFLGLGLEPLWEINVQFSEIPVTCVCFLLSDDNVICTLASFSSSLPESSKPQINIHKAFYRFRSPSFDRLLTHWAKPRRWSFTVWVKCASREALLRRKWNVNRILAPVLHGRAESEKYNESNLERKLRTTKVN